MNNFNKSYDKVNIYVNIYKLIETLFTFLLYQIDA